MNSKTGTALILSVMLALTGCGEGQTQKISDNEISENSISALVQTEQTIPEADVATQSADQDWVWEKWTSRYYQRGAYLQLNPKVKLPAQMRCTIPDHGYYNISVATAAVSHREYNLWYKGKMMPSKYYLKKDKVYCTKKYAFLYDINASKAKEVSLLEDTVLSDANYIVSHPSVDENWEETIPEYDSWFHGCTKVKRIVVKKIDRKQKSKADKYNGRSGLYTQGDMLFYTKPEKGLYAVLINRKGNVSVPSGLKEIYSCAFQKCGEITDVFIPASVKHIGKASFGYNTKLKKIDVSAGNRNYKSVGGVLYSKDGKKLIAYPAGKKNSSYRVPEGVEKIADGAFMGAVHLNKIVLPDSLRYVGHKAFMDCSELREIQNKKVIKKFKNTALINCDKITVWPKRGATR